MERQSKFLPDSISGALKNVARRALGAVLVCVGVWAISALMLHDPYLSGFAAAGTFGVQTFMGNVVGFMRYAIGFIPTLFVLMCVVRLGGAFVVRRDAFVAPEYNFLRGFVATIMGAFGFGMIMPSSTFGGLAGYMLAADMSYLIGGGTQILGIGCLGVFFVLAGALLHIKLAHIKSVLRTLWRTLRGLMAAFHMTTPRASVDNGAGDNGTAPESMSARKEASNRRTTRTAKKTTPISQPTAMAAAPARRTPDGYCLPDPKLLEKSVFGKGVVTPELKQRAALMENAFEQYNVFGKVVGIRPGPIVTLYEYLPESGTRMVDINKTVADMTRAMAAEKIRIAPISGTQFVGVEMVNLKPFTVRYQTLMDNEAFITSKYKIPLALGVNIGGNPMYYDLAKMPHMLIAGRTGSGKSVFVQSIITSIVYHFTPDKCKLIIIDPKGVDFGFWDDIPHLITPIVKLDPNAAVNALKWAVREMEERYKQMQILNARNVESYNELAAERRASGKPVTRQVAVGTDPETGELLFETQNVDISDMPYIVIIIDEVADLMALARKEVEACVQRIAQKARAAGIHLVMATQRPDATTITGVIKANFPTRISFQARSNIDSMTTLGEKGAENLLACGDMLFSEAGRVPVRIHGAFISDEELTRVGNFLRAQGEPEYASGVTDGDVGGDGAGIPGAIPQKGDKDADLYTQAKEIVQRDKKPTISYLQRRLGVGYNKAASLMEKMEQDGIVSAPDANNKRTIL